MPTVDRPRAEAWIRTHVTPVGPIETAHERPWSTVLRVPVADGLVWFKACAPLQAFEPRLSARLCARWPEVAPEILGYDQARAWMLLADAGVPLQALDNPPGAWLAVLPPYAELQRGEARWAADHLAHGVPDQRLAVWPARFDDLLRHALPLERAELDWLAAFAPRFAEMCRALAAHAVPDSLQHDDLHMLNVFRAGDRLRVLDWGDASISHPVVSLVVTFRYLQEINHLPPGDAWFTRLRDAYLEPWGQGYADAFRLAMAAGGFAHLFGWIRQRDGLPPEARPRFDVNFRVVLRHAVAQVTTAKLLHD
jgi:hypothetical protein